MEEARRKPAVCRARLVLLLIVASSAAVSAASNADSERCWKDDDHHPICVIDDCIATCRDHGHEDGRCTWAWLPACQCLLADCH